MALEQILSTDAIHAVLMGDETGFKYFAMRLENDEYLIFPYLYAFDKNITELRYN